MHISSIAWGVPDPSPRESGWGLGTRQMCAHNRRGGGGGGGRVKTKGGHVPIKISRFALVTGPLLLMGQ